MFSLKNSKNKYKKKIFLVWLYFQHPLITASELAECFTPCMKDGLYTYGDSSAFRFILQRPTDFFDTRTELGG